MKKRSVYLSMLFVAGCVSAQIGKVGINTDNPKATLDIHPSANNMRAGSSTNEGILIPRLSKTRVSQITTPEESTLVYVNDLTYTGTDTRVAGISEKGFYYFNSLNTWVKVNSGTSVGTDKNIYEGNGTLTGDRVVNMGSYNLTFDSNDAGKNVIVKNNSYYPLIINSTNTGGGGLAIHPNDINKRVEFSVNAAGNARIWADGDRIFINRTTGDVGIGTDNPNLRLHLMKDTDHLMRIQRGGSTDFTDFIKRQNGTFNIYNNTGGTWNHGLTITNSGYAGIGTESPEQKLHVSGSILSDGVLFSRISDEIGGRISLLNYSKTGTDAAYQWVLFNMTGGYGNSLQFWRYFQGGNGGMVMTLADNGNVGIGTSTPTQRLEVHGDGYFPMLVNAVNTGSGGGNEGGGGIAIYPNGDFNKRVELSVTNNGSFRIWQNNGNKMYINNDDNVAGIYTRSLIIQGANGENVYIGGDGFGTDVEFGSVNSGIENVTLWNPTLGRAMRLSAMSVYTVEDIEGRNLTARGSIYQTSDRRYKTNIKTIENGIDKIQKLRPVTYYWNAEGVKKGAEADKEHIGFIAQEVEEILPQLVKTDKKGYKSVSYAEVVPVLTKAVQELKAENEALKARLEKIEKIIHKK